MKINKDFKNVKGTIEFELAYDDSSNSYERFNFKDLQQLLYKLSKAFEDKLIYESGCDECYVDGIYFESENGLYVCCAEGGIEGSISSKLSGDEVVEQYENKIISMKNNMKEIGEQLIRMSK